MTDEIRIILDEQPVAHGLFAPVTPTRPSVAVVYSTGFGDVACFDGRALSRSEQRKSKFRYRFEVDVSDHRPELWSAALPSLDDAYQFQALIDAGFRVTDPETVVRRDIRDARPVVCRFLIDCLRPIGRKHDIGQARAAEDEINTLFDRDMILPEGITIYRCAVRLELDQAARAHLQKLREIERKGVVGGKEHSLAVAHAQHRHSMEKLAAQHQHELDEFEAPEQRAREIADAKHRAVLAQMDQAARLEAEKVEIELRPERRAAEMAEAEHLVRVERVRQDARLEREKLERDALANLPQNLMGLLTVHLQRHPDETAYVNELYARHREALGTRQDENDKRSVELFHYMVDRGLIQPVDVERWRDKALFEVQQAATPVREALVASGTWDDPLPEAQVIPGTTIPEPSAGAEASAAGEWLAPPSAATPLPTDVIVPVYLAVDESSAGADYLEALNAGLARIPDLLSQDPDTVDAIRLSLLGFADDVALRIPMVGVMRGGFVPKLAARSGRRLAPVFTDLRTRIVDDVDRFKGNGFRVNRPTLVMLCAGEADDATDWPLAHSRLTDRDAFPSAPNIVACGVGRSGPQFLARLATAPRQAFVAPPAADVQRSVQAFTEFVAHLVTSSARDVLSGRGSAMLDRPAGFVPADGS